MKVYVNHQVLTVDDDFTLTQLLEELDRNKRVAIWINDKQILQKEYSTKKLNSDDHIKIIRILAGG